MEERCCLFLRIDCLSVCISLCLSLSLVSFSLSRSLSVHLSLTRSLEFPHPKSESLRQTQASATTCRLTPAAATYVISPLQQSPFFARPPAPEHTRAHTHIHTRRARSDPASRRKLHRHAGCACAVQATLNATFTDDAAPILCAAFRGKNKSRSRVVKKNSPRGHEDATQQVTLDV